MTHQECYEKVRPVVPCSRQHLTFGGRCLNCGYDPEQNKHKETVRLPSVPKA